MLDIQPVTLEGRWVRLESMQREHLEALLKAAGDDAIWRWFPQPLNQEGHMRKWLDQALVNAARGEDLPFVVVERSTGAIAGSTRYLDIHAEHHGLEIGNTWLGTRWWRTAINSECKYLLLSHAFDTLGAIRVCLKTDALNERSRRAIERLGARQEGLLRKHMIVFGGRVRDSVYYSITDEEWPSIRVRMIAGLYGPLSAGTPLPQ